MITFCVNGAAIVVEGEDRGGGGVEELHSGMGVKGLRVNGEGLRGVKMDGYL